MKTKLAQRLSACFVLFFAVATTGLSQSLAAKFGKIDKEELQTTVYANDTSAEAVILSDVGRVYFRFSHTANVIFERHTRIKILKKSGYAWADVSVPIYSSKEGKEGVSQVKGYTYNLVNGEVVKDKLESKAVYNEQMTENWSVDKFTLPNVKEGSVIEYTYTINSDFIYTLRNWEFQTTIPTLWSEYKSQIPEYYDYTFQLKGYHKLHNQKANSIDPVLDNNYYVWSMKDVPALREEKFITTLRDYQSRLDFELRQVKYPGQSARQLTESWDQVIYDRLLKNEHFGLQINKNRYFKDQVAAIVAIHKTPEQQMEAIHALVKRKMKWDGKNRVFTEQPLRKAFDAGKGNSAEINLMLIAMLQEAGIDAAPVLLSTRDHGYVHKGSSPLLSMFNTVVALATVNGKEYLLDATDPLLPVGMISMQCLNREGRLIKEKTDRWVALTPSGIQQKTMQGEITINSKGEMLGQMTQQYNGYRGVNARQEYFEDGEEKFVEQNLRSTGDFKIVRTNFSNQQEVDKPFEVKFNVEVAGNSVDNDILYLNPMLGLNEKENPFRSNERSYPVDFATAVDETFMCKYILPAGYEIDEVPAGVNLNLPNGGGKFIYTVSKNNNEVLVLSKITLSKPIFYAQEYPYLKEFFNQIVAKQAQQIVLKKSSASAK